VNGPLHGGVSGDFHMSGRFAENGSGAGVKPMAPPGGRFHAIDVASFSVGFPEIPADP